jgi:HKD family nuclease
VLHVEKTQELNRMIAEFIGQGLFDDTEESIGNHICSTLNNLQFDEVTFFNAFLRSKGLKELKPFIKKAQKNGTNFTFFVGIDEKITSKEALEMLLELGVDTYVYSSKQFLFHPKVYVFEGKYAVELLLVHQISQNQDCFTM